MTIYTIYRHTSPSGKSYIGQTTNPKHREYLHKRSDNACPAFRKAIQKYGWDNFIHETLIICSTLEDANDKESHFINLYNSLSPNGYNLTTGGTNIKFSQEVIDKIQQSRSWYKHHSEETKQKISISNTGRIPNQETRRKMSESGRGNANRNGKLDSEETRQRKSRSHTGLKESLETRMKKSLAARGKPKSEETKRKLSEAAKRRHQKKLMHVSVRSL